MTTTTMIILRLLSLLLLATHAVAQNFALCSVCGRGLIVSNREAPIFIPGSGGPTTCGFLQDSGLTGLVDPTLCPLLPSLLATSACGCEPGVATAAPVVVPTLAPVVPPTFAPVRRGGFPICNICGNGKIISNPTGLITFAGQPEPISCIELQNRGLNGLIDTTFCAIVPGLTVVCQCREPTEAPVTMSPVVPTTLAPIEPTTSPPTATYSPTIFTNCSSVCMDGSPVPNELRSKTVTIDIFPLTCGLLEVSATRGTLTAEECKIITALGVTSCGCPDLRPYETCDLCEDGSVPERGRTFPPDVSCDLLSEELFYASRTDNCTIQQGIYGTYCGCNNTVSSQSICRICDGPLNDPFLKATIFGTETCGEIELQVNSGERNMTCSEMKEEYSGPCCYVPPQPNCTLCPSVEDTVLPKNILNIGEDTETCEAVAVQLANGELSTTDCDFMKYLGLTYCGCDDVGFTDITCDVCEDGRQPPDWTQPLFNGYTCAEAIALTQMVYKTGDNCTGYQATVGQYCGCNNVIASLDACRICGDGNLLPSFARPATGSNFTCGELEVILNINADQGEEQCTEAQAMYGVECCTTFDKCSVCPENQAITIPEGDLTTIVGSPYTCAQAALEGPLGLIDPLSCTRVQSFSSTFCGCQRFDTDSPSLVPSTIPSVGPSGTPSSQASDLPTLLTGSPTEAPTPSPTPNPTPNPTVSGTVSRSSGLLTSFVLFVGVWLLK